MFFMVNLDEILQISAIEKIKINIWELIWMIHLLAWKQQGRIQNKMALDGYMLNIS